MSGKENYSLLLGSQENILRNILPIFLNTLLFLNFLVLNVVYNQIIQHFEEHKKIVCVDVICRFILFCIFEKKSLHYMNVLCYNYGNLYRNILWTNDFFLTEFGLCVLWYCKGLKADHHLMSSYTSTCC